MTYKKGDNREKLLPQEDKPTHKEEKKSGFGGFFDFFKRKGADSPASSSDNDDDNSYRPMDGGPKQGLVV